MTTPTDEISLFLCGDVMLGRGIDQILSHPVTPELYEAWVRDARDYRALAEREHGHIPSPVPDDYVWGDALTELERRRPDVRLINLETAVTDDGTPWPGKGIHYRMHPDNLAVVETLSPQGISLANNHILDWGFDGLTRTLKALDNAHLPHAGAGETETEAMRPLAIPLPDGGRLLFVACGTGSSGIPSAWTAHEREAGVFRLPDLSLDTVERMKQALDPHRRRGDRLVVSIHWGGNWGYEIEQEQRFFARALIDNLDVDIVHGHSSHHPKPMELYNGKLILYGCGDFINDYEGIQGHEAYRPDLALMYFARLAAGDGTLRDLTLVPLTLNRFKLHRAGRDDARWLAETLERTASDFDRHFRVTDDATLVLT